MNSSYGRLFSFCARPRGRVLRGRKFLGENENACCVLNGVINPIRAGVNESRGALRK